MDEINFNMDNEKYQKIVVEFNYGEKYQGDIVSHLIVKLTQKYIESPILDVGAGSGALTNVLKNRKYNAIGIDLYPKGEDIKKGSITNLKFKDKTFNTVFCTEVIEHLTDKQIDKGLNEVKRVLKKGGHFIVSVPYNENLENNSFVCPKCGHKFHKVGHLQSFDEERMKNLLEKHDFKIVFMKIYALGAMSKLPFGRYFNFLFRKLDYEFISKTLVVVSKNN